MKFNDDWFSSNIPTFEKIKNLTPIHKVLEIGVHEGLSTCWMLDKFLPANGMMMCVDPLPKERHDLFLENVTEVKKPEQTVCIYPLPSSQVLPYLLTQETRYDFVYVDGSHAAPDVLFDAVNSWHLLRQGGVMLLDDWGGGEGVKLGSAGFLGAFQGQYSIIEDGYQLGLQKL